MSKKNDLPTSYKTQTDNNNRGNTNSLPGRPGYRTREGRSGYDPIDTRIEAAHVSGSFLQKLFTGQLRIKNIFLLLLTGSLGLALITPITLAIFELLEGNLPSLGTWIPFLIAGMIGLALLFNFFKNVIKII